MLAIIIPYFKITFFEETLASLAAQTCKDFKVYIGNDASPENPTNLLEKYGGKFDFVYHRFDENLGGTSLTQQWDRCIALSNNEEWIMILGDDDILSENVVESFYNNHNEFSKGGSNVIKFASIAYDISSNISTKKYQNSLLEDAAVFYLNKINGKVRSSLSEHIFKRNSYLKYGFKNYPLAWHSDDFAWLSFADKKPIYCINESFVKVNVSSESISGNKENLLQKHRAESLFFNDIIQSHLYLFTKKNQIILLYRIEEIIKKTRKLETKDWKYLAQGYWLIFKLIPLIKFGRRYIIYLFK